jgi:hypothetical protein
MALAVRRFSKTIRFALYPARPCRQGENRPHTEGFDIPIHVPVRKAIGEAGRGQEKFVIIFIALLLGCDKKGQRQQAWQRKMTWRVAENRNEEH